MSKWRNWACMFLKLNFSQNAFSGRIPCSLASMWLGAGGEGNDRGWDGWMASLTQWTWVWVNSGSWWWTGRPGVLWFMRLQRVGHDWATNANVQDASQKRPHRGDEGGRWEGRGQRTSRPPWVPCHPSTSTCPPPRSSPNPAMVGFWLRIRFVGMIN